jgi:DNA-binding response OmpR family regulator
MTMSKLLVVDDDENLLVLCREELRQEGYEVLVAHDGKEALSLLALEKPELVVLDIVMPKMDGLEMVGKIVGRRPCTRVIINTAYAAYRENFMSWAADAYVVKSPNLEGLKHTIDEVLHRVQSQTSNDEQTAANRSP